MNKIFLTIFVLSLIIFNYCSTEPESEQERNYIDFIIKIDKITFQDTLSVNDTLTIQFYGLVGYDGCHQFKEFETSQNSSEIHITTLGTKPNFETICPTVMVYLDGKEFKTIFQQIGNYKIIIHQPDNSLLIESLVVM